MSATQSPPWHAAFPDPKSPPQFITRAETLQLFNTQTAGRDFVLVDVRRTDFEGGTIKHSINLPAHSLYHTLSAVYALLAAAGIKTVVFYCGSSAGRGPRSARWLQDHVDQQNGNIRSVALEGGIKGWVRAGAEYVELMEGYDAASWASEGAGAC